MRETGHNASSPAARSHRQRATRTQSFLLLGICAVALGLRLQGFGSFSLSHYDEGVYVYNGLQAAFGDPLAFNFEQPLHSPPLYPWAIAAVCRLLQAPWPAAGVLVSIVAGVATVPIVYLLGRRLGGTACGLVAAALLGCSDLHIAFSRMALTDVPLTLFFSAAIYLAMRLHDSLAAEPHAGSQRAAWMWTVSFAAATGVAWNTKYNGWMPLAIAVAATAALWFRELLGPRRIEPNASIPLTRSLLHAGAATLIAGLCYLPWYWYVNSEFPGGYSAVTDHHRTYIGGLTAWPATAWRHLLVLTGFRHFGWVLAVGGLFGGALIWLIRTTAAARRTQLPDRRRLLGWSLLGSVTLAAVFVLGTDCTIILLAVAALAASLCCGRYDEVLVSVWIAAFLVLVPLYHPYTRLLLPLLVGSICSTALAATRIAAALSDGGEPAAGTAIRERAGLDVLAGAAAAALLTAVMIFARPFGAVPSPALWHRWSTRQSYQAVGDAILRVTEPESFVICQAQPTLSIYVPRERLPIGNVPFADLLARIPRERPCYLAVDFFWLHSQPGHAALDGITALSGRLRPVATVENDLNLVTLADFLTPQQIAAKIAADPNPAAGPGPLPPPLSANLRDVITIFAIERE